MSARILKAKEYARIWNAAIAAEKNLALKIIKDRFTDEIRTLISQYGASSMDKVLKNVLEQQQKKWNAICRNANGEQLKPYLFDRIIESYDPLLFQMWDDYLKSKKKGTNDAS